MEQFSDDIRRELELFEVGEIVELFRVDATKIGGGIYHFAASPVIDDAGAQVAPRFGGQEYTVVPFESDGWEYSAGGSLPQPSVRFLTAADPEDDRVSAAAVRALVALVEQTDDLLNAELLRLQTLRKHLDDGEDPNPQAHMGVDVYTIARKTNQTSQMIEFQLQAALDLEDVVLPRRQVLNHCGHSYRRAVDGAFDYSQVSCPYVGEAMFDASDEPVTDPALDMCSFQLSGCKARFGTHAVLPFGGFPGVGKIKTGF